MIIAQVFLYKARNQSGELTEGLIEADNEEIVVKRLREKGFYITSIEKEADDQNNINLNLKALSRVGLKDLALFCRQFSTMVSSGLSLVRSLDILSDQIQNPKLKDAINSVQGKVQEGMSLSVAMKQEKKIFPQLLISMIEAGEIGGLLDNTLEEMSNHFESEHELSQKVRSALAYPIVIAIVAVFVVVFLVGWILPKFAGIFAGSGQQLPLVTRSLLEMSKLFKSHWYLIPVIIGAPIAAVYFYYQSENGRKRIDSLLLKLPIFGDLITKISVARFSKTFGVLLDSGVSILEGLDIVSKLMGNKAIADVIRESKQSISEGESIAIPLRKNGIFPRMVLQMIKVGEETGRLDEMLLKIADFYEKEVEHKVEAVVSLIEPLMILVLAGVVGFIVLALMLPMFDMIQTV
ncbi:type II secretion system F family protein [Orenia marismortui]|uniref:Type IV pilus assembly protein PilC n=1 Tax=Orenia marismortui TaxID=46469 RepID=A0A4R8H6D7_9FIRM|nr:type II secretion system F family protein [Orenia marismortui]TDX53036.1 type IV pilus assembly protein PilC [Orenia marismortui]